MSGGPGYIPRADGFYIAAHLVSVTSPGAHCVQRKPHGKQAVRIFSECLSVEKVAQRPSICPFRIASATVSKIWKGESLFTLAMINTAITAPITPP